MTANLQPNFGVNDPLPPAPTKTGKPESITLGKEWFDCRRCALLAVTAICARIKCLCPGIQWRH